SDAYRALDQTVPADKKSPELEMLIDWLGELVRQVDSSLIDEWEMLSDPERAIANAEEEHGVAEIAPPRSLVQQRGAFTVMVRNALFQRVQAAAFDQVARLGELDGPQGFTERDWDEALEAYYAEYPSIRIDAEARSPRFCRIDESREAEGVWEFRQVLLDPENNHDWAIEGE